MVGFGFALYFLQSQPTLVNSKYMDIAALAPRKSYYSSSFFFFFLFDGVGEGKHYALMDVHFQFCQRNDSELHKKKVT